MIVSSLLTTYPALFAAVAGVFGLVLGSFLNVVVHRLPIMLERRWRAECNELSGSAIPATSEHYDLVAPGSRCPHCDHQLSAWENIPVASFVWLRGKCSACAKPISLRYPAVELLTGLMSAAVAWRFGFGAAAFAGLAFTWALVALSFIDLDRQLLPDNITLPLLWAGLIINLFGLFASLPSAVIGAVAGYLTLWSVYQVFKLITGREGMGYGDFKLFAAFGAWLGWQSLPLIILLSSFVGAIIGLGVILFLGRDRTLPIPFGPFLCLAGWIALLWGDAITHAYLQVARFSG